LLNIHGSANFTAAAFATKCYTVNSTKIISLPPVHEISLFEPLPKIHDHSDDWNKTELTLIALWCLKLLCCDHRALKFTQNCICFTNPFINRPVTRWGAGVALPPWKNVLDIV